MFYWYFILYVSIVKSVAFSTCSVHVFVYIDF